MAHDFWGWLLTAKIRIHAAILGIACLMAGCQSGPNNAAPPVTPALTSLSSDSARNTATLERGRHLFVSRCVECHVLPAIRRYPEDRWPRIVNWMADRAGLKPPDREAMTAYIIAAHRQLEKSN
ncbi:MAG: hypothetical protein ACJ8M1_10865 [Chthoniobacterales bacterium]